MPGTVPADIWAVPEDMRLFSGALVDKHDAPRECPPHAPFCLRACRAIAPPSCAATRRPLTPLLTAPPPCLTPYPCARPAPHRSARREAAQVVRRAQAPGRQVLLARPRVHLPHLAAPDRLLILQPERRRLCQPGPGRGAQRAAAAAYVQGHQGGRAPARVCGRGFGRARMWTLGRGRRGSAAGGGPSTPSESTSCCALAAMWGRERWRVRRAAPARGLPKSARNLGSA